MDIASLGPVELGVGLINLVLAVATLGTITYFWLKHHRAGLNRAWWVLAIGFTAFAIAQALEYRRLLFTAPNPLNPDSLELTARTVFVCVAALGLWRLFDESLKAKQRSLDAAEATIQLLRMQADSARQGRELNLLLKIVQLLASQTSVQSLLEEICRSARDVFKARSVWIRLRQPLAGGFQMAADHAAVESGSAPTGPRLDAVFAEVMRTGKPIIREMSAPPSPGDPLSRYVVLSGFPLRRGEETIGGLVVGHEVRQILSLDEQQLAKGLADQAALGVVHAQLAEQVELSDRLDAHTGLASRRQFDETLRTETRRAGRYRLPLALMLVHLGKLKEYSKAYGPPAGDAYVKFFAQYLRQRSRDSDLVARLGSDEFGIIMPNTSLTGVHNAAERLRQSFGDLAFEWEQQRLPVAASVGVAAWGVGEAAQPEALLAAASRALSGALEARSVADPAR